MRTEREVVEAVVGMLGTHSISQIASRLGLTKGAVSGLAFRYANGPHRMPWKPRTEWAYRPLPDIIRSIP